MSKSTFFRNVQELMAIGLSKSDIQNLHKDEHIPLAQVLTFDFQNQRPENYKEQEIPFKSGSELRAYLTGQHVVDVALNELDMVRNELEKHGLISVYARALAAGREVRLNQNKSVSFMWFSDGSSRLIFHEPHNLSKELEPPTNY